MVPENSPALADIDALLRFLPLFEDPSTPYVVGSGGLEPTGDGAITTWYPIYSEPVLAFFRLAGQPCWADYAYNPHDAGAMLADDVVVERASLSELRTMLTYCVRGERFGDGFWDWVLRTGRVTALLRRLRVVRDELAAEGKG